MFLYRFFSSCEKSHSIFGHKCLFVSSIISLPVFLAKGSSIIVLRAWLSLSLLTSKLDLRSAILVFQFRILGYNFPELVTHSFLNIVVISFCKKLKMASDRLVHVRSVCELEDVLANGAQLLIVFMKSLEWSDWNNAHILVQRWNDLKGVAQQQNNCLRVSISQKYLDIQQHRNTSAGAKLVMVLVWQNMVEVLDGLWWHHWSLRFMSWILLLILSIAWRYQVDHFFKPLNNTGHFGLWHFGYHYELKIWLHLVKESTSFGP